MRPRGPRELAARARPRHPAGRRTARRARLLDRAVALCGRAGSPLALRLRVGEALRGSALPRDPTHLARFTAVGPEAELAVSGADGAEPAGFLVAPAGA